MLESFVVLIGLLIGGLFRGLTKSSRKYTRRRGNGRFQ